MARKTEMLKGNGDTILGKLKKHIGETGEALDYSLAWMERQAAETADMDVPILSKAADAIVNPALVGARAALANVASGGGKYYQPEARDEKHFSKAALRELGETVKSMRGRTWGRADGIDNAAQFNLTQTIGGFSVKNGTVTDKFDINKHYHGVPDALTSVARTVLGREEDPDAGKVKTHIPLTALGLQQASKGGNASGASGVRQAAGGGTTKISYEDLRKLADTTYKGDVRAAVYSLDPKVVTATVDSFGGNIDRTNRPMYIHRGKDGKITGYSTTNSGDALDKGVKPEGRFQSVLVPFVRQGKDGPEYTEDYNVAQKWYDESGQHYGKFDMDFTTPEAKARSIDRFNAASWLVHREQQLRYQPEFDKLVEAERRQAAKGGNATGESKPSAAPKGHNPALDGYSGPRVVINPQVMKDDRDALCVAFNESFRIIQEINGFDPVAEPTEKQRAFFADTAYRDDERMLRRTILSRICTFDTSVTDPTDEQLQEAVEFLDTVLEIGAPQNQWEQRAVERIRTAISKALESGERVPASQAPIPEGSPEIAAGGAGSSAGGVPEDEEKDSGAEFRENAQAQMDEAAKLAQEGPTAEEQKVQAMADAAGKVAGDDPFGKSAEMNAAAQEAGLKADIAEAQKPENLMQKNGHYVDAQGRVISERAAKELAEQGVRNAAAQDTNDKQQVPVAGMDAAQNSPRTASERTGTTSGIKAPGGRELTAGEAAWQERRQASTAAWMQRTGGSGDGVADALAQRDERANNLRQPTQVDSGRRDALGRRLDDRGRVIT